MAQRRVILNEDQIPDFGGGGYKLLQESINPTGYLSASFGTQLTGGLLGTNSFDGASDTSYEGRIFYKAIDQSGSSFDLRFTLFGQNFTVNVRQGSGSQTWLCFIDFRIIIQGGQFLLAGTTKSVLETDDFEYIRNFNDNTVIYTATGTSALAIDAVCLGLGAPTLYLHSLILTQIK
jgi:hypothetical protein